MENHNLPKRGSQDPSGRSYRWLLIGLALLMLLAALTLAWEVEDTADVRRAAAPAPAPLVSVLEAEPRSSVASISAYAELRPRWDAEIRAAVSGRIEAVHDDALAGRRVDAGAPLFRIEQTRYAADVAAAELSLEQARLALWRAETAVSVARGQFERAGTEPPNELALRLPELRIAQQTVASAEAQLAAAKRRLSDTEVRAPFAGIVTQRMASPGQTVAAGEALVHLSDNRSLEAVVELSQHDWSLLTHPLEGSSAALVRQDGTQLGQATVREGGGFLDPMTRQRRIFLDIPANGGSLLAGDLVRVVFTGRPIKHTLTIPESALTRTGHVWFVDADNRLLRFTPQLLFRSQASLTFSAPSGGDTWRVATTPLASFLQGQRVEPKSASLRTARN